MEMQEIRQQLPTGSDKIIASQTGLNSATVRKVFYNQKVKNETKTLVIKAMTELLKQQKEVEKQALQELQAVASA